MIGFDLAATDRAELEAVVAAGGGTFTEVASDSLSSMFDELRRQNSNFIERLHASNTNFGTRLRNDNRTFSAGLKLTNCVFSRGLGESNALYDWARERKLDAADGAALRAALVAREEALVARPTAQVAAAKHTTSEANDGIQAVQDDIDRKAEALR